MAALTAVRTDVRREARDLRWESRLLRVANERKLRECRRRRHECLVEFARTKRILMQPLRSGWSDLRWERPGPELRRVLVPLSGKR